MSDNRSLREKLEAMANQTASPDEAEIARAMLAERFASRDNPESPRVLTREQIFAAPDRKTQGGTMRFRTKGGTWYTIDVDELDLHIRRDA